MESSSTCFICGERLGEDDLKRTIQETALKTFTEASRRRQDGHYTWLRKQKSVTVHEKCRKGVYTKESSIASAEKDASTQARRVTRTQVDVFDFKSQCLICGNDASDLFIQRQLKKEKSRREVVSKVETLETINSIRNTATAKGDSLGEEVARRISTAIDLAAAEGRYHRQCYVTFSRGTDRSGTSSGRPETVASSECIEFICKYLEDNEDVCQFTLNEILQHYSGAVPRSDRIVSQLREIYQDDILVTPGKNQYMPTTICYRNTGHQILSSSWYDSRKNDTGDERLRIVKAAAEIIREDIRTQVYTLDKYPSPDLFLDSIDSDIPHSLKLFLTTVVKKKNPSEGRE